MESLLDHPPIFSEESPTAIFVKSSNTNHSIIQAGGEASYRGNTHADAALFSLGFLDQATDKALFEDLYACPILEPPSQALLFPKLTEVFNMRGTMAYCSSFTPFSLSATHDTRFRVLEHECISILSEIRKDPDTSSDNSKEVFEKHPEVEKKLVEMRAIVDKIMLLEKQRSRS